MMTDDMEQIRLRIDELAKFSQTALSEINDIRSQVNEQRQRLRELENIGIRNKKKK